MKVEQITLAQLHKDLTPAEEIALANALKENPVIARWISLIEQDVLLEERTMGALLDMPPEQVKARQTFSAGKREVLVTICSTINQVTK